MYLKKLLTAIPILFFITNCFSQETVEKRNRLTDNVTEKFAVLKDNKQIKSGLYQAYFQRKTAIASGQYVNGKKTGKWYFYNANSTLWQIYNYDKDSLQFEAREDTTSSLRYLIDQEIADTDKVTKPIKAGGRYYGYLPYLGIYKTPFDPYIYGSARGYGFIELLISPLGRLAEYKVRVVMPFLQFDQTITMDTHIFKEEDRKFIPATFNGQPILSRIVIRCIVTSDGGLDYF